MKTSWILLCMCVLFPPSPCAASWGEWKALPDLPFLAGLEARDAHHFFATAPQSELLLLLDCEGNILTQSHGAGTGLEGFRYPAEVDGRSSMTLFVVEQDRVLRLDQKLNPLGSYNLLEDDFLVSPDLLAQTPTRELIIAESRTGHVLKVDAFSSSMRMVDYSDLPRALHLASMEVVGERLFLLDRPTTSPSHLFIQDLFSLHLDEFPIDSCLVLHRDLLGESLLLLNQSSAGLECMRLLPFSNTPENLELSLLFQLPPLPSPDLPRDFLVFESCVLLLQEDGRLFISTPNRASTGTDL